MDPIADMLTHIRNASAAGNPSASVSYSRLNQAIAEALMQNGWIAEVTTRGKKTKKAIEIVLKYADGVPTISNIKRISKLGKRIYKGWRELRSVRQGHGMALLSTPAGLLTDSEARKRKAGGEVLLEVW